MTLDRARQAAWDVYMNRVNVIVTEQYNAFSRGEHPDSLLCKPPTKEAVELIRRAMSDAQRDIISRALEPVYRALDKIDNAKSKSPVVAEIRAELQRSYDELHALKDNPSGPGTELALAT